MVKVSFLTTTSHQKQFPVSWSLNWGVGKMCLVHLRLVHLSRRVLCIKIVHLRVAEKYTICVLPSLQTLQTAGVTLFITSRIPFVTLYIDSINKCHSQLSDCSM